MTTIQEIKRRSRGILGPLFGCLFLTYFVYHSLQGEHGILAWWSLNLRIAEAESVLLDLQLQQSTLNHRVRMLLPQSLDPDLLEEQGRRLLNFTHPDDMILLPIKVTTSLSK